MGATRHFGLCCIQGTGHLLPMAAIGRALCARGHRVSCFQDARARAMIKAAGLEWQPIGLSRDVRAVHDGNANANGATRHVAPTPILMDDLCARASAASPTARRSIWFTPTAPGRWPTIQSS